MKVFDKLDQKSEEWDNLRRIRPTASRLSEIFTAKKADLSSSAEKYAAEIVTQQMFDVNPDPPSFFGNANTENGNEREPAARGAFTALTGLPLQQVGFCVEDAGFYGCSPDALIPAPDGGFSAGFECKCPLAKTHVSYLVAGVLPDAYVQQVYGSMYITGLREWHFFSHFPTLPDFHLLVKWDDAYGAKMSKALDDFRILYAKTRVSILEKLQLKK